MPTKSKYTLVVDNVSSATPTKDLDYEFGYYGKIRALSRDNKLRVALIEFDRAGDAKAAWNKMDGFKLDGRRWKVDWADRQDYKLFNWKWDEGSPSPEPRGRSRSRSPPPNNRVPDTPYNKESQQGTSPRSPRH